MSNFLDKLKAAYSVFQLGKEVTNVEKLKSGSITSGYIVAFLSSLIFFLNQFECSFCDIQVDNNTLISLSTGILALISIINNILTAASSKRATLSPVQNVKTLLKKSEYEKEVEVSDSLAKNEISFEEVIEYEEIPEIPKALANKISKHKKSKK